MTAVDQGLMSVGYYAILILSVIIPYIKHIKKCRDTLGFVGVQGTTIDKLQIWIE